MAVLFFGFGLFAIVHPNKVKTAMGSFADSRKKSSWHPYRMPLPVLRLTVGSIGIVGAALFLYIAYVAQRR